MTRIITLITLGTLLSGCIQTYAPHLSKEPNDSVQYQSDLNYCRDYIRSHPYQPTSGQVLSGGFGALGVLAYGTLTSDKYPDKTSFDLIDDCMTSKGYSIAGRNGK